MAIIELKYYWCVRVDKSLAIEEEIYLYSDIVEIENGNLLFKKEDGVILFCVASGMWTLFFAASTIDGAAYVVEHWKGFTPWKDDDL